MDTYLMETDIPSVASEVWRHRSSLGCDFGPPAAQSRGCLSVVKARQQVLRVQRRLSAGAPQWPNFRPSVEHVAKHLISVTARRWVRH